MKCIKIHTVKSGKIDGKDIDGFLEVVEEDPLYLIDIDSHMKKEMNLKVYEELSGLFELWIDAAPRKHYDIMDILIIGGNRSIINSYFIKWKEVEKALELTENVTLKSYNLEDIEKFIEYGGKEIITSAKLAPFLNSIVYIIKGGEICLWKN